MCAAVFMQYLRRVLVFPGQQLPALLSNWSAGVMPTAQPLLVAIQQGELNFIPKYSSALLQRGQWMWEKYVNRQVPLQESSLINGYLMSLPQVAKYRFCICFGYISFIFLLYNFLDNVKKVERIPFMPIIIISSKYLVFFLLIFFFFRFVFVFGFFWGILFVFLMLVILKLVFCSKM